MKKRLVKSFIPHEDNDYLPDLLQRGAMVLMLAMVVVSFTASNVYALLWQQSSWLVGAVLPAVVISETNKERGNADLPALVRNPVLDEAARLKAEHMAKNSYFAHYSPDGVSPWYWFNQVSYRYVHAGENLAVHFTDSDEVVEAWMKSPTHRANIVNTSYREIGVGTAKGKFDGYDTVFVVQLFGTPAATSSIVADAGIPVVPQSKDSLVLEAPETDIEPEVAGIESEDSEVVETAINALAEPETTLTYTEPLPTAVVGSTTLPDNTVILYTDTLTTSTDALPAEVIATVAPVNSSWSGLVTSPSRLLQIVYIVLGGLVTVALVASLIIEWRRHRVRQVVYGVGLLGVMSFLFFIHTLVTGGVLIV